MNEYRQQRMKKPNRSRIPSAFKCRLDRAPAYDAAQ
ncbi:hypothetical protein BDSB_26010 [Burkholderia dolosa PC543]|nr:hypothetical protein BDSB_26010 [Burkholderia dolosa PC543]